MESLPDAHIQRLARSCVNDMGDIFWDRGEADESRGHLDPSVVATKSVATTIQRLANVLSSPSPYSAPLRMEYQDLVAQLGPFASDEVIEAALMSECDWSKTGARVVLQLARRYGTSVLRNALALADAMGIEDGDEGL